MTHAFPPSIPPILHTDKHGQLGIWDPRVPADDVGDEEADPEVQEGGKYWRLQVHWPATSRSSISCIRFDPTNTHSASRPMFTFDRSGLTKFLCNRSIQAHTTAQSAASQWALESPERSSPQGTFLSIPSTSTPKDVSYGSPMPPEESHTLISEWTNLRLLGTAFQGRRWGVSA